MLHIYLFRTLAYFAISTHPQSHIQLTLSCKTQVSCVAGMTVHCIYTSVCALQFMYYLVRSLWCVCFILILCVVTIILLWVHYYTVCTVLFASWCVPCYVDEITFCTLWKCLYRCRKSEFVIVFTAQLGSLGTIMDRHPICRCRLSI